MMPFGRRTVSQLSGTQLSRTLNGTGILSEGTWKHLATPTALLNVTFDVSLVFISAPDCYLGWTMGRRFRAPDPPPEVH